MVTINNNRAWDVAGGVARIITPGMPAQVVTPVSSVQLDKDIERHTRRRDQMTAELAAKQAELDAVAAIVTDLTALRVTVTAEP
jgi:hypothetical protein